MSNSPTPPAQANDRPQAHDRSQASDRILGNLFEVDPPGNRTRDKVEHASGELGKSSALLTEPEQQVTLRTNPTSATVNPYLMGTKPPADSSKFWQTAPLSKEGTGPFEGSPLGLEAGTTPTPPAIKANPFGLTDPADIQFYQMVTNLPDSEQVYRDQCLHLLEERGKLQDKAARVAQWEAQCAERERNLRTREEMARFEQTTGQSQDGSQTSETGRLDINDQLKNLDSISQVTEAKTEISINKVAEMALQLIPKEPHLRQRLYNEILATEQANLGCKRFVLRATRPQGSPQPTGGNSPLTAQQSPHVRRHTNEIQSGN